MIHTHPSLATQRFVDLNAHQKTDSPKFTLLSKISGNITMEKRLGFVDVSKTQEQRVRCASWLSGNHTPLLKLFCSLEKQSARVCARMLAKFHVNQSLKLLQKLLSQIIQLPDVRYRWTYKFQKFGLSTNQYQSFLSNLRMLREKF